MTKPLPATYYGQCAELCGVAHAQMRFRVTVMTEEDYQAWVANYGPPQALTPPAPSRARHSSRYTARCAIPSPARRLEAVAKSRIDSFMTGGDSVAVPGPNLTDLRTRQTLAAGITDLTVENLRAWIKNPEDIKPGNWMYDKAAFYEEDGDATLTDDQIDALIEYLLNLR